MIPRDVRVGASFRWADTILVPARIAAKVLFALAVLAIAFSLSFGRADGHHSCDGNIGAAHCGRHLRFRAIATYREPST